jgi:hypothetical protein
LSLNTGHDLDQSRLTGAIFPHQRMDLAPFERKVHIVKGLHHWKGFIDTFQYNNIFIRLHHNRCASVLDKEPQIKLFNDRVKLRVFLSHIE